MHDFRDVSIERRHEEVTDRWSNGAICPLAHRGQIARGTEHTCAQNRWANVDKDTLCEEKSSTRLLYAHLPHISSV